MHRCVRSFNLLPFVLLSMGMALASCSKDDDTPAPAPPSGGGNNTSPSTTPNFADAHASLWAVRAFTTQSTPFGDMDMEIGTGVAVFSNDGFATMVSAGQVKLNDHVLTAASNNAYTFTPSASAPTGIDLSSGALSWEVAGSAQFSGFTQAYTNSTFPNPTVGTISSGTTVVRANGYTLTAGTVNNADSVIFMVGDVVRTLPPNTSSHTFSAGDLSGLSAGQSLVQVVPYAYKLQVIGGKNVYFGKQMARSKSVTIQ